MDIRALPGGFSVAELVGDRVSVSPLAREDRRALVEAASDPGIWAGHPATDRYRARVFEPYLDEIMSAGGGVTLRDSDGQAIGMSRFYASSDAPEGIGIGFTFLVRSHWGGATNFEVKRLMLAHLFRFVDEAWFHIAPTNIRSQKATAKLGAVPEDSRILDLGAGRTEWVRMRLRKAQWYAAGH
ncbi:GNAT family N-acetyltransferase [Rhodobacteraceae bacterium M385]|nr:GNAT family N-acetyltransferase [Rhodobacteraceae bacterium M385]